jgi:hypothetical protein
MGASILHVVGYIPSLWLCQCVSRTVHLFRDATLA